MSVTKVLVLPGSLLAGTSGPIKKQTRNRLHEQTPQAAGGRLALALIGTVPPRLPSSRPAPWVGPGRGDLRQQRRRPISLDLGKRLAAIAASDTFTLLPSTASSRLPVAPPP
jgi:hypothetical protein